MMIKFFAGPRLASGEIRETSGVVQAAATVSLADACCPPSWVLRNRLLVGPAPRESGALAQLRSLGVVSLLNLCEPQETADQGWAASPAGLHRYASPLPDSRSGRPITAAALAVALGRARQLLQEQPALYVHCAVGQERSPLVVLGVLCLEQGWDLIEGLAQLRRLHPPARPRTAHLEVLEQVLLEQRRERHG